MRIEFRYWPGNTEVLLIEELGDGMHTVDRFYTSARQSRLLDTYIVSYRDVSRLFYALEDTLPKPDFSPPFGHLNPYWEERRKRREAREAKK